MSRRGRERRVSVVLLVAIAIGIASVLMATLAAQAVVARSSCNDHPLEVNVAVSDDIDPAVQSVAQLFNRQDHQAAGRCVKVHLTREEPAAEAAAIDGASSSGGLPAADAWIPDSTLWVDVARTIPVGAQRIQTTGITVARSPLMIVMPPAAAAQVPAFNNSVGWSFLLPPNAGGPTSSQQVRVELPDPTQSAAGLATLIEMNRLLGTGATARTSLTTFVRSAQSSAQFDDPKSLATFVTLANPPLNAHPVTVSSEQAVLSYDAAHPGHPLAARYPVGVTGALGAPELDYPYVVTSTEPAEVTAANEFGKLLQQGYTAALVRHYGFRSANGTTGTLPADYGLPEQTLQLATQATASEALTALQVWNKLQIGSRDLALVDVSSAMGAPSGLPGVTLEQELTQTASVGLALFPDSTQLGLWEFADHLSGSLPYKQLVPVGPLPGELGLISRRQQIEQIIAMSAKPLAGAPAALDQTILAAYQQMVDSYQPNHTNAVIVLTAGVDNAPGDISPATLASKLHALYNPNRPVELIIVVVGSKGNLAAMQQIAAAGGGAAYPVTDPTQVGQVFFAAVSRRICQAGSCGTP